MEITPFLAPPVQRATEVRPPSSRSWLPRGRLTPSLPLVSAAVPVRVPRLTDSVAAIRPQDSAEIGEEVRRPSLAAVLAPVVPVRLATRRQVLGSGSTPRLLCPDNGTRLRLRPYAVRPRLRPFREIGASRVSTALLRRPLL